MPKKKCKIVTKYKIFNGKRYVHQFGRKTKSEAEKDIRIFRKKGYSARFVKFKTTPLCLYDYTYQIYTHKKR